GTFAYHRSRSSSRFRFSIHATSPTESYTLSLHDALPISFSTETTSPPVWSCALYTPLIIGTLAFRKTYSRRLNRRFLDEIGPVLDRKSTRLNSSHLVISYAVFCLKKKTDL